MTDTLASIEAGSTSGSEKRRSSRVPLAVPITVTGVDALGEPFRELTTTLSVSCNGCKYKSKNYVQRDSLVTLEVMHPNPRLSSRVVKGRARWVQRPRNLREQYEIGLEFIVSGNVWGLQSPPPDWFPHPDDEALLKEQQEKVAAVAQELVAEIAAPEGANFKTLDEALEEAAATPPISTVTYEEIDISGAIGFVPEEPESAPADLNARLQETITTSLKTMMNHMAEAAAQRIASRIASAIDEARTACGMAADEFEERIREVLEDALSPEEIEAQTASVEKQSKRRARKAAKKRARQSGDAESGDR